MVCTLSALRITAIHRRFWLWRAIPDRGSEDCRHVDNGQVVTGIQDVNMEGRCQEGDKLVAKANLTASLLGWKSSSFLTVPVT